MNGYETEKNSSAIRRESGDGVHKCNPPFTFIANESPMANLLLSVMGAFAEFERALIKERQLEGIALAKKRGVYKGRKKALNSGQAQELKQRVATGEQKSKIAREFGISRETLYQYLKWNK